MTLRPGSADMARPRWRGVIRSDSFPWAVCTHTDHQDQKSATACGKAAFEHVKAQAAEPYTLPEGWLGWDDWRRIYGSRL